MKLMLFGATGMIGQGVLREALLDPGVSRVLTVGRKTTGQSHSKLVELATPDLFDLGPIESQLAGYDACFFTLGVSAAGMSEAAYARMTYDLTLSAAQTLVRHNPAMTFMYVSGMGTDSTEKGRVMWARVKGRTENALLRLPFRAVYIFRPGAVQPLHGITSRTAWYRALYAVTGFMLPVVKKLFPNGVTTTEQMGRAAIAVAKQGYPKQILETKDINTL
jgi:uncharacterized protein YbjT (DUF2867 family)